MHPCVRLLGPRRQNDDDDLIVLVDCGAFNHPTRSLSPLGTKAHAMAARLHRTQDKRKEKEKKIENSASEGHCCRIIYQHEKGAHRHRPWPVGDPGLPLARRTSVVMYQLGSESGAYGRANPEIDRPSAVLRGSSRARARFDGPCPPLVVHMFLGRCEALFVMLPGLLLAETLFFLDLYALPHVFLARCEKTICFLSRNVLGLRG